MILYFCYSHICNVAIFFILIYGKLFIHFQPLAILHDESYVRNWWKINYKAHIVHACSERNEDTIYFFMEDPLSINQL